MRPRIPEDPPEYDPVDPPRHTVPCISCAGGSDPALCDRLLCLPKDRPDGRQCVFAKKRLYGNEEDA